MIVATVAARLEQSEIAGAKRRRTESPAAYDCLLRGIEHARGVYVAPLDADDIWHPDKIARQVAAMREGGPAVGMVYAWSLRIDEAGCVLSRPASLPRYVGDVYPFLVLYNFVSNGSTPLLRRDCVLQAGGYDPSLRARGGSARTEGV